MVQTGLESLVSPLPHRRDHPVADLDCPANATPPAHAQDQPLLSSSLQTAHNLSVLPSLIESLMGDLGELVGRKVKAAFDLAALAREVGGKGALAAAGSDSRKADTDPHNIA